MSKDKKGREIEFPADIVALRREKEDIKAFLQSLEDAYNEGAVTEDSYSEMKKKNAKRLSEINSLLDEKDEEEILPLEKPKEPEKPQEKKSEEKKKEFTDKIKGLTTKASIFKSISKMMPKKKEEPKDEKAAVAEEDKSPAPLAAKPAVSPVEILDTNKALEEAYMRQTLEAQAARRMDEPQRGGLGADAIKLSEEINRLNVEVEKLRAFLEAVKEMRTNTDERVHKVSETVGEIRSTLYQTEASLREMETKVDQHEDAIASVKPKRFMDEIRERDRRIGALEGKVDKSESLLNSVNTDVKKVQDMLRDIGSLENIVEVSRNIAKKILEMDAKEKSIIKVSDRIERLFVDISEKLTEFETYKANQDRISEMVQELTKTVDDIGITLGVKTATKDDLTALKDELTRSIEQTKILMASQISPEVAQLQEEKESIKVLLDSLDAEYKEGTLLEEDYSKSRDANIARLRDIERKMSQASGARTEEPEPIIVEKSSKKKTAKKAEEEIEEEKPKSKKQDSLLRELQEMYDKGLISKEAFERSKKAFGGRG